LALNMRSHLKVGGTANVEKIIRSRVRVTTDSRAGVSGDAGDAANS